MTDYIQVEFEDLTNVQIDIIIALLIEINYEGFEEEGGLVRAYIPSKDFEEEKLKAIAEDQHLSFSVTEVEKRNWNQLWESNFDPVFIDNFVAIRAEFHQPVKNVKHEIIITPKMSFGTGHHATTSMMIRMMRDLNFTGKKILDFGTGTGILAILAEKLDAKEILAIDNDDWSIENAAENLRINNCSKIQLINTSSSEGDHEFDIILVNIIKNVILANFSSFAKQLVPNGIMLFSGLLKNDEPEIIQVVTKNHMKVKEKMSDGDWICMEVSKD